MLAPEYAARVRSIGAATGTLLAGQWDSAGLWSDKLSTAAGLVAVGQTRVAAMADGYVSGYVGGADLTIVPSAFAGVASDGRPLASLMVGAAVAANAVSGGEFPLLTYASLDAMRAAQTRAAKAWLLMAAMTQIADAARASLRSSMAVRDVSGLRVANLPCCGRCAVLAGRVYHWSAGFQRHPRCDCTMQPIEGKASVAEGDEIPLDQIRGLSAADRKAVEMGANLQDVVNAQRGMYSADVYGKRVKATFDSTQHRDAKFPTRDNPNSPRLRPESILKFADGNPDEAIRLLKRFGYIK